MHVDRPLPRSRATRHAQLAGAVALATAAAAGAVAGSTVAPSATLPDAAAEPTTSPSTSPTASSAAPTGTSATGSSATGGSFPIDGDGYVDSAARCDDDQVPVAFGRTSRALVAVCVDRDGQLEYRGVRLSDKASGNVPAGRAADGAIVASNDGVTYAVSPSMLLVSEGDTVIYRDAWIEFREPRFSEETQKPAATSTSSTSTSPTSTAPTTTVTTTTVTVTPSSREDS